MAKAIHYAKKGLAKHWWGLGWHTACGMQIEVPVSVWSTTHMGENRMNTTDSKDDTTCGRCKGGMEFACKTCHRNPCACEEE